MLEVVGVDVAVFQRRVGDYVVVHDTDLQVVALFFQVVFDFFQNDGVGGGACADDDGFSVVFAAAGDCGESEREGEEGGKGGFEEFFHKK